MAADISASAVEIASKNFKKPNIKFIESDIFKILSGTLKFDGICIVNSLFLLPEHDKLFALIKSGLKTTNAKLLIIVPNIEGENFKAFAANNPGVNRSILGLNELTVKLSDYGFHVSEAKEIAYASYYGRKELKYFSVFACFYLTALHLLFSLNKKNKGNYILLTCTTIENN